MISNSSTFSERIDDAMYRAGLNAKQLCKRMVQDGSRVSEASISNWRNGVGALPNGENLVALCKALDVTPDYLLGFTDVPNLGIEDAEALRRAEAYTRLPPFALETIRHNAAYPFIAPSCDARLEGFKNLDASRTANELARLLAQNDFLRALETLESAREYRRALKSLTAQNYDFGRDEAIHSAESDYLYLKYLINDAITKSVNTILEND